MTDDPTDAQILAAAISIAVASRNLIQRTDRTSYRDVCEVLDALHEHLAVAGGSLHLLAERLGHRAEVERLVNEGQDRMAAFRACQGLGGRA
ncbi:hypothetical protein [Paracoccus aminophilus]|uniref:hypothetical protein n=1 Tax=Paracoccus aminophilus TaxID=34003 RepID=UPI0004080DE1|nr:hypothetical protein [Paracoccus aminophilus]